MSSNSVVSKAAPVVLSIARAVIGFLVLWHGLIKVFGFPAGQGEAVPIMSLKGLTGVIELVGGALMAAPDPEAKVRELAGPDEGTREHLV